MPRYDKRNSFVVKKFKMNGKSLSNNFLRDPAEREVIVLERNVKDSTPALIGLAGFFGSSLSFMNRSYTALDFPQVLNKITDDVSSFLIVLPDTMTSYYGNQYVNSPAVGNYEDFIVKDVVGFINERYGKRKLGLFGKSSGGFGSYSIASKHPDIFDGFVDVSGDAGFEYCYLRDFPMAISKLDKIRPDRFLYYFRNNPKPDNSDLGTMNILAMAAFYSPNDNVKIGFDLPFDLRFHTLKQEVWGKWLIYDPLRNVEERLENLSDEKVILQVGKRDEFSINIGMKGMSRKLQKNKIKHDYKEYDVGHFGIEYLYVESIPSLINALAK